jgi:hypothetical protein
MPPRGREKRERVWISYVPADAVLADIANLTAVGRHEPVLAPKEPWEAIKLRGGAPPVRIPSGWLVTYHGVSQVQGRLEYSMGIAILNAERPSRVLYRTPLRVLEPETDYERSGLTSNVVFPSATDGRTDGRMMCITVLRTASSPQPTSPCRVSCSRISSNEPRRKSIGRRARCRPPVDRLRRSFAFGLRPSRLSGKARQAPDMFKEGRVAGVAATGSATSLAPMGFELVV